MGQENHSDRLEDDRFIELPPVEIDQVPSQLQWLSEQEEYFVDEIVGVTQDEVNALKIVAQRAFDLFVKATDRIIDRSELANIGIPSFFHEAITHSWSKRSSKHPFLFGRFDISGGIGELPSKVIEFNADTCTMVPETILWQPIQLAHAGKMMAFNMLSHDLTESLLNMRAKYEETPVVLGTSLGYPEDQANIKCILSLIENNDNFFTFYSDLEHVVFTEDGVFLEDGDGHIQVDIMVKLFPWDWAYNEEPELARLLSKLIVDEKVMILNPPYTTIWQNKRFLNYITTHFPDNDVIAKSFATAPADQKKYVAKSAHGRLGEEVTIVKQNKSTKIKHDVKSYQEFLKLPRDEEGNHYQLGLYYTNAPSALNIRCSEDAIVDDDCEFYCHYIA